MRYDLLFFALCAFVYAGCDSVDEPNDNADASATDTDADCDGGMGDCDAPWGWYDETSGLCWELPPYETEMTWYDADTHCQGRTSGGHCDWRLPTISELRSVMRGCEGTMTGGACGVTDECTMMTCWDEESCSPPCDFSGPGQGGCLWDAGIVGECVAEYIWFWSSTNLGETYERWMIEFTEGRIYRLAADQAGSRPWCVRTGL